MKRALSRAVWSHVWSGVLVCVVAFGLGYSEQAGRLSADVIVVSRASAQGHCPGRPASCEVTTRDDAGCCPVRRAVGAGWGQAGRTCALTLVVTDRHCCWPDESWSRAEGRCVPPSNRNVPPEMVWVPGGTFWMGSPSGMGDELPVRRVTLSSYYMDRTEVTVAAYGECVASSRCAPPPTGRFFNWGVQGRETHPVNGVSWQDANAYCQWAGRRLPTEAEWEYAARGTDGRAYPWGSEAASASRMCGFSMTRFPHPSNPLPAARTGTCEAGAQRTNVSPFGVADMTGNVTEWTSDWYGPYVGDGLLDPSGPSGGQARVVRGGGWIGDELMRTFHRHSLAPTDRGGYTIGFRCAREASR
jgi:formylglycine-generating enzyme required for sulfatase activity